jgi:hypothetical protein
MNVDGGDIKIGKDALLRDCTSLRERRVVALADEDLLIGRGIEPKFVLAAAVVSDMTRQPPCSR